MHPVHARLEALYATTDHAGRLAADPVRYVHACTTPEDQEVAAVFAALLAFGKVTLFFPVLDRLAAHAGARGGFRAWVEAARFEEEAAALDDVRYRWARGADLALLAAGLGGLIRSHGSLQGAFLHCLSPVDDDVRPALTGLVAALHTRMAEAGPVPSRSTFHALVPSPAGGSACKRWNLALRWLVRGTAEGVDLGLWGVDPALLVIPLDTHVLRLARFLGLTRRVDGSWRTAREVTRALAVFDPADPVRFDFALAHLGIRGACRGHRDDAACPACPLQTACQAPYPSRAPRPVKTTRRSPSARSSSTA